jgi:hypothetical protein
MLRHLFIGVLSLILALSSVTLAASQHASAGGVTLVLCTDGGDAVITLDATGNEVPKDHVCPDCIAAIGAQALPANTALPLPPLAVQAMWISGLAVMAPSTPKAPTRARGPPLML